MNQSYNRNMDKDLIIDLKELFWRILEQWKAIVVFVIIIMLLFSAFMYHRNIAAYEADTESIQNISDPEDLLISLSEKDQEAVLGALRVKQNLDNLRDYIYQSPLMSLDPYRVNTLTVSIVIRSDDSINKQLIYAYGTELTSSDVADAVNKAWGSEYSTEQVRELISVSNGISIDTEADLEGNILNLSLYIPDERDPGMALEAINNCLPEIMYELTGEFGEHSVKVFDSEVQILDDKDFSERQYNVFGRLYNLTYQLSYITNQMNQDQKNVYESLVNYYSVLEENAENDDDTVAVRPSFFTKRGLGIGFILGCFLYACAYLLYFVFSGKIFGPAVIKEAYGIRTLGEWHGNKKTEKLAFLFTDEFINRTRHKGHLDLTREVDRVKESVLSSLPEVGNSRLLLVSRNDASKGAKEFTDLLVQKLNAVGITTEMAEINLSEGTVLGENMIKHNDGVVIMVDQSNTLIKEVKDAVEKCIYCSRPVIGAVYIR